MIFSSECSSEEIYARVRRKKRSGDGLPADGPPPEDPLWSELGQGTGALAELLSGIESNRNVHDFPLDSPIPIVGGLVKGGKLAFRRALRYYLARQTGYNQYALEFLRVLAEQDLRLSAWAQEQEARTLRAEERAAQLQGTLAAAHERCAHLEARLERAADAERALRAEQAALASAQEAAAARVLSLAGEHAEARRRLDVVVGLLDLPLDQVVIARAERPAPPLPPSRPERPRIPHLSFAPPGGRRAAYRELVPHLARCRRVLDLGCGEGELLELLREAGVDALGIDIDGDSVASARARGGAAEQHDAFTFLAAAPPGSFDGVAALHLLEHFDPEGAYGLLCLSRAVLPIGGILVVATPNPESYFAQMVHFWRDPEHVRPYPLPLLEELVKAAGFVVVASGADPATRPEWLP